jgi:hypothetical protein
MSSYLTTAQKSAYSQAFYDIHDTFSRDIVIWKHANTTLISTTPDYNFLYSQVQPSVQVQYTPVSGVFPARIKWENPHKINDARDIKPTIRGNYCRIKIKGNALNFISGAERIEIDGRPMHWIGSSQLHGLFTGDFYDLYLREGE